MGPRGAGLWVGALLVLATSGCGRSGVIDPAAGGEGDDGFPFPQGDPFEPAPSPTPGGPGGRDGVRDFLASIELEHECEVLVRGTGTELQLWKRNALFTDGRPVLVIQMADRLPLDASGETMDHPDLSRAGRWELAEIAAVSEDRLALEAPLALAEGYESDLSGRRAQVCLVRDYDRVTVRANVNVQPKPWDGERGGVLAWRVRDALVIETGGRIGADGRGFRGGWCGTAGFAKSVEGYDVSSGRGGGKGEGLDARWYLQASLGRGSVGNAGGGGNGDNAGGGGGANGGRGGDGGREEGNVGEFELDPPRTWGLAGGAALDATRLVFGGGGGAGHLQTSIPLVRCGGAGGGVVLLRVGRLEGAGAITAVGASGVEVTQNGAGGGGAGGTIDLEVGNASAWTGVVLADGGEGGDVKNYSFTNNYGPGGGGGGGLVRTRGLLDPTRIAARGGESGSNQTSGARWGAARGEGGTVVFQ